MKLVPGQKVFPTARGSPSKSGGQLIFCSVFASKLITILHSPKADEIFMLKSKAKDPKSKSKKIKTCSQFSFAKRFRGLAPKLEELERFYCGEAKIAKSCLLTLLGIVNNNYFPFFLFTTQRAVGRDSKSVVQLIYNKLIDHMNVILLMFICETIPCFIILLPPLQICPTGSDLLDRGCPTSHVSLLE